MTLTNSQQNPVAFFNRIALVNTVTDKRILPSFFSNNYISVLPGETKSITVEYPESETSNPKAIEVYGWNVEEQRIEIK